MNVLTEIEKKHNRLLQVRTDALTAEYIYSKYLNTLASFSNAILLLSVITPLLVLIALYPSKGTAAEAAVLIFSYFSSAALLCLSITALVLRVESKKENFLASRAANTFISNESQELLDDSSKDTSWFFRYASHQDSVDQNNIGTVRDNLRKEAYRESLKKLKPGDGMIVCASCKSSPFDFKEGDCQLCGNTREK